MIEHHTCFNPFTCKKPSTGIPISPWHVNPIPIYAKNFCDDSTNEPNQRLKNKRLNRASQYSEALFNIDDLQGTLGFFNEQGSNSLKLPGEKWLWKFSTRKRAVHKLLDLFHGNGQGRISFPNHFFMRLEDFNVFSSIAI